MFVGATVPHAGEHAVPFCANVHVTLPLLASLLTVPLICSVVPTGTFAEVGDNETEIAGTVIAIAIDFVGSATADAVRFTIKSVAGGPGAV